MLAARYRVELLLRDGRASTRLLGRDMTTSRPVSIEILAADSEASDEIGVRFLASARRMANLHTSNVTRVLDAGVTADGHPYVVSEAIAGETIAKALELRGAAPTEEAVDVAIDICEALAEAHAHGLLHGDLTTDVIQIAPVKVAGIGTTHVTLALRGSDELGIRAPEQLDPANPIDARTDVWGVGVVLYTMLAGASPFACDSPSTQSLSVALDEPALLGGVPDALADVVDSCLAKNPVLRPHTIIRLAEELAPFASDPKSALARIAQWEECPRESSPTLIVSMYDALRREKDAASLTDADSTAPRTALARETLRREGVIDVSDPRLEVSLDMEPSVRDVLQSEPPPAVTRTLPPSPREMPTVVTRRPGWKLGMHPLTLVGASACIIVATVIGAAVIQRSGAGGDSPRAAALVSTPPVLPAPEPREAPPPQVAAPVVPVMTAAALPDSTTTAPKRVVKPKPATSAVPSDATEKPEKIAKPQPAPEPKASDDDLRRFLDDRR